MGSIATLYGSLEQVRIVQWKGAAEWEKTHCSINGLECKKTHFYRLSKKFLTFFKAREYYY